MTIDIRRIDTRFDRWNELLALILEAFDYMNTRIDPPSSALALTSESLRKKADAEIAFVAMDGDDMLACMFLRPEPPHGLYVGKLAVRPSAQGRGLGWALLGVAENEAQARNLSQLRLETRIELVENHATFGAWGFLKTAENSHPGFSRKTFIEMRKQL
jgi:ribosomal protein S18 acetylase RimI-like enzyme